MFSDEEMSDFATQNYTRGSFWEVGIGFLRSAYQSAITCHLEHGK